MSSGAHNPTHISEAFAANFMAAPRACFFILSASLTVEQFRAAVARIEAGHIDPRMPEYLSGFAAGHGLDKAERAVPQKKLIPVEQRGEPYLYIKRAYGRAFQPGQRVMHIETWRRGAVAKENLGRAHHVQVLFDGDAKPVPCHPNALQFISIDSTSDEACDG